MLIWSFLIPVITCLILFFKFRKETVWWEYLIVFIPSILVTILIEVIIKEIKVSDTHYTSEVVSSIRHYDKWNEYIHKTCTRRVPCGSDGKGHTRYRTVTYDCSYVKTHSEYWEAITYKGKREIVEPELFMYYKNLWGTPEKFIDMHRRYHTLDGDAQEYSWDKDRSHTLTLSESKSYRNYFKLSGNLYKQEEIPKEVADSLGLPEYPKCGYQGRFGFWVYNQKSILGLNVGEDDIRYIQWFNSQHSDLRINIVYFKEKDISVSRILEKYWEKGKDNEVTFCIGLDKSNRKTWIYSFSWSPEPLLEGYVKMECKYGSPKEIIKLTQEAYNLGYWRPRDFKDYSYITIDLSSGDYSWIFWITIIVNILISVWVINNEYGEK